MEKIDLSRINELCLPYMKRPKKIIGAKVVLLDDIKNKAGDRMERGEVAIIWQSFRGYGLKAVHDGVEKVIARVSHYSVRFLKDGYEKM